MRNAEINTSERVKRLDNRRQSKDDLSLADFDVNITPLSTANIPYSG